MNYEVITKVKDFVKRFRSGELEIDTEKFGNWASSTYGTNPLYEELATAIHEFEIRDEKSYLKAKIDFYEERYPKLKQSIESGEEGDVKEDE